MRKTLQSLTTTGLEAAAPAWGTLSSLDDHVARRPSLVMIVGVLLVACLVPSTQP